MPAQSPVTLENGVTDDVYAPAGRDSKLNHVWRWLKTASSGFRVATKSLSVSNREQPNGETRVRTVLVHPVVQVVEVDGVDTPKLVRTSSYDGTFRFHPDATPEEREALRKQVATLYTAATSADVGYLDKVYDDNEQVW